MSKEPTELEKLQQDYNNQAFRLGNCIYQQHLLKTEEASLKSKMEELSKAAAPLMKQPVAEASVTDGTAEQSTATEVVQ